MNADIKKRGLGRGLDALFGDVKREEQSFSHQAAPAGDAKTKRASELEQSAGAVTQSAAPSSAQRKLSVEKLTPGKFQPRRHFNDDALDQLADSIAVHGILQPILVRALGSANNANTMYEIIAGERRWRAAQKAQLHEVPVVIQDMTDKQALEIALIENLQREDLNILEEADGYQRLMDEFGHTQEQLSQALGKSRSHIANILRLLKLPASIKQKLQQGVLTQGHARALLNARNPEEIADIVVARNLNVRQTEQLINKAPEGKERPMMSTGRGSAKQNFRKKDVDILALEEKMTALLGLRVEIMTQGEDAMEGKLVIEYKSLEQLDDVLARLSSLPKK